MRRARDAPRLEARAAQIAAARRLWGRIGGRQAMRIPPTNCAAPSRVFTRGGEGRRARAGRRRSQQRAICIVFLGRRAQQQQQVFVSINKTSRSVCMRAPARCARVKKGGQQPCTATAAREGPTSLRGCQRELVEERGRRRRGKSYKKNFQRTDMCVCVCVKEECPCCLYIGGCLG